ncbi:aldo/keto reductase [Paenibacillus hunanensis]|uniref:Diketogulonate reductase-like aldo/keto reductase n=1 Tax=Paenibacillus hunanensis TaxID=539262 RepID=A0ABU1IZZ9_9BACL|nr:aldo/keto reductase [Paenibacillus hunanensis]MDR6244832.1 diketogulonate reductase-like aldo/keto reductase [Paenibacillus hunanensis]GGJ04455.1 oxidoreductase [Paenibacillus hunanensis]
MLKQTITLPDGTVLPAIGQGTWNMGDDASRRTEEIAALQAGIDAGMTLIDTAEMYGEGRSEELIGEAIRGRRDEVFLVSKVYPHHAGGKKLVQSCEQSLKRLGTDHLDLYLLHWRGRIPLQETVEGMQRLIEDGKIRRWGVSNLDVDDMNELMRIKGAEQCVVNQVLYHLGSRGIEYDLLPWQQEHRMPVMAYSPLAQAGSLRRELIQHPVVQQIADEQDAEPFQIMLSWCIRSGSVMAIPKASTVEHASSNAEAANIKLSEQQLRQLDEAFPAPQHKVPLDMI